LPTWFDPLEEGFSYFKVLFKMFCLPVKTSYPLAKNIDETLMLLEVHLKYINYCCGGIGPSCFYSLRGILLSKSYTHPFYSGNLRVEESQCGECDHNLIN